MAVPVVMLFTAFVLLPVSFETAAADCSPAEEGSATSLTCAGNWSCSPTSDVLSLIWKAGKAGKAPRVSHVAYCGCASCQASREDYLNDISATLSPEGSNLTIFKVSRTSPFDMETAWRCEAQAGGPNVTACDKLEIFARPSRPTCSVNQVVATGHPKSFLLTCSTSKVYPRAKCEFQFATDNGQPRNVTRGVAYTHTTVRESPVYYRSQCSVSVPVEDLGQGTHSFQVYVFPDVTGGSRLVDAIQLEKNIVSLEIKTSMVSDISRGMQCFQWSHLTTFTLECSLSLVFLSSTAVCLLLLALVVSAVWVKRRKKRNRNLADAHNQQELQSFTKSSTPESGLPTTDNEYEDIIEPNTDSSKHSSSGLPRAMSPSQDPSHDTCQQQAADYSHLEDVRDDGEQSYAGLIAEAPSPDDIVCSQRESSAYVNFPKQPPPSGTSEGKSDYIDMTGTPGEITDMFYQGLGKCESYAS